MCRCTVVCFTFVSFVGIYGRDIYRVWIRNENEYHLRKREARDLLAATQFVVSWRRRWADCLVCRSVTHLESKEDSEEQKKNKSRSPHQIYDIGVAFYLTRFPKLVLAASSAQAAAHFRLQDRAMSNVPSQTAGASLGQTEALLPGVLAAAKAALPKGLDLLVRGASRLGDQATLRCLLENGGGTSWTPSEDDDELEEGNSCLRVASRMGHEGAVRELLESVVDVDEVRTDYGTTALYSAVREGHEGPAVQRGEAP